MLKEGQLTGKALVVIILSVIIMLSFITKANEYGSGEAQQKQAIANDLALIINQLYALPGDVSFFYSQDASRYTISVERNIITVYSDSGSPDEFTAGKASFVGYGFTSLTKKPNPLLISKKGNTFSMSQG